MSMSTPQGGTLSPAEREQFAAVVERLRQFRRRAGVPDGVTLEEAVALHIISAEELARALGTSRATGDGADRHDRGEESAGPAGRIPSFIIPRLAVAAGRISSIGPRGCGIRCPIASVPPRALNQL
jgi:hypothetical protein